VEEEEEEEEEEESTTNKGLKKLGSVKNLK
jgi:hypothetical protein